MGANPKKSAPSPEGAVQQWPLSRLIEFAGNPRKHEPDTVSRAAAAIREFGFRVPILARSGGLIIDGHLRLKAARQLGLATVPVLLADDLTDAQVKAFRLSVNKIADLAEWDQDLLAFELDGLRDMAFDMDSIGFAPGELNDLIGTPNTGFDPDEVPPAPVVPVSRTGDLWVLGPNHKLLCGDATKAEDVARLMGGAKARLMLTDPPYGISIVQCATVGGGKPVTIAGKRAGTIRAHGASPFGGVKNKRGTVGATNWVDATEYLPIHGDDKPFDPAHLIGMAERHILFGGNYFASRLTDGRCWLVWDKNNTGNFADAELAWTDIDAGVKLYRHTWNGLVREGVRAEELVKRVHPTQKPVGLFSAILGDFSADGDVVIDPYLGSGTTLIACEKLGRACRAMEIEEHYADIAVLRFEKFTGKPATLDGDGRTFEEVKRERTETKAAADQRPGGTTPAGLVDAPAKAAVA
ncbi:MAG: DNA methyltransferase [Burkholderiales bacterium]